MSSISKTLFERNTVPLDYIWTFLDLPDIGKASAACKRTRDLPASRMVWKTLAPSFGLPSRRWALYSFEEGKSNLELLRRVCDLYNQSASKGKLRSQFCTQVKPEVQAWSHEDFRSWFQSIQGNMAAMSTTVELIVVTRDISDFEIFGIVIESFQQLMRNNGRFDIVGLRGVAMNAFLCLASHGFIPETHNSLEFIWQFCGLETVESAPQLVKTLFKNPLFEASPDCFHRAICSDLHWKSHSDCLTSMVDLGAAKPLPPRKVELDSAKLLPPYRDSWVELPSTLGFVVQRKGADVLPEMLRLLLDAGAAPTGETLCELLGRSTHSIRRRFVVDHGELILSAEQVMKAVAVLADAKVAGLFDHPFILSYACLFSSDGLMKQLRDAGAKCNSSDTSENTLDHFLGLLPTPSMVDQLLRNGAKKSSVTATTLYKESDNLTTIQELEALIFPNGIASDEGPDAEDVANLYDKRAQRH